MSAPAVPVAKILAALLALPQSSLDRGENLEQRTALYLPIAEGISEIAKTDRQAALLGAQAWEDSKLARYVIEYRCKDGPAGQRCDDGRSFGVFQVSVRYCRGGSVAAEARCALKAAGGGIERCGKHAQSRIHAAFVGLAGGGKPCNWAGAEHRVNTYRKVLASIQRGAG